MKCSNCGSEIPYAGRICPLCHTDKSRDKDLAFQASVSGGLSVAGFIVGLVLGAGFWFSVMIGVVCGVAAHAFHDYFYTG